MMASGKMMPSLTLTGQEGDQCNDSKQATLCGFRSKGLWKSGTKIFNLGTYFGVVGRHIYVCIILYSLRYVHYVVHKQSRMLFYYSLIRV